MPEYQVYLNGYASTSMKVVADTPQEAAEKAEVEVYVGVCHQCAREVEIGDEWEADSVYDKVGAEPLWSKRNG